MNPSQTSPVLQFLQRPENLVPALQVAAYADELRQHVATGFLGRLVNSMKRKRGDAVLSDWGWEDPIVKRGEWALEFRPRQNGKDRQALAYRIEVGSCDERYLGFGLFWAMNSEKEFGTISKLKALEPLHTCLEDWARAAECGEIDADPNDYWFWWQYWERQTFDDPWVWFAEVRADAWFDEKAERFWSFIKLTHQALLQANRALGLRPAGRARA